MNLRKDLSELLRECKKVSGLTYDDMVDLSGCSKTSIRYALNGGEGVGLDVFQKLLDCTDQKVQITRLKGYE